LKIKVPIVEEHVIDDDSVTKTNEILPSISQDRRISIKLKSGRQLGQKQTPHLKASQSRLLTKI
jgi:hypothetical protein